MTADLHTLVGAYALDAVSAEEESQFQRHLATCASCRGELAELQETAARLGEAAAATPPARLRQVVLEALRRTPQDRPRAASPGSSRGWRPARPLLTAAAVLAVVLGLGGFLAERVADEHNQQSAVASVVSAKDAEQRSAHVATGGSLRVVVSQSLDKAVVTLAGVPRLDAQHSYQVWRLGPGAPQSAAVLSETDRPESLTALVDSLDHTRAITVTVEPAGGSPRPTTKPLATVAVT